VVSIERGIHPSLYFEKHLFGGIYIGNAFFGILIEKIKKTNSLSPKILKIHFLPSISFSIDNTV